MDMSAGDTPVRDHSAAHVLKVAYILHRFPHLTETFIVRELLEIRKHAVSVEIFSLLSPRPGPVHEDVRELLCLTHYSALFSRKAVCAQLHFIRQAPHRYFHAVLKVIRLSYREPGLLLRVLIVFPKCVYFAKQMQDLGIQHIHAHFAWLGGIAAGMISELLGITYTVHPHAFDLFTRNLKGVQALLDDADHIVTISEYHRDYVAAICPQKALNKIAVIHCGLDINQIEADRKSVDKTVLTVLSVGSLIEKKGFEYLIDACARLVQRGISFRCEIVGGGPRWRRELLQAQITRHGLQDRVMLLGPMTQDQVAECYHRSEIFALPCVVARGGDRDGIPVVLMEAMAHELPVVTTAVAGIPELVEDGVTGLLVKQRDAECLAGTLETLMADRTLRRKLGMKARQKVQADFTIQQSAKELAFVFQQLASHSD